MNALKILTTVMLMPIVITLSDPSRVGANLVLQEMESTAVKVNIYLRLSVKRFSSVAFTSAFKLINKSIF